MYIYVCITSCLENCLKAWQNLHKDEVKVPNFNLSGHFHVNIVVSRGDAVRLHQLQRICSQALDKGTDQEMEPAGQSQSKVAVDGYY